MSAQPRSNAPRPIAFPGAAEPFGRLVAFSRAVSAERVSQRMLRAAGKELTLLFEAEAALVSQLEDGLLREIADYARSERQVARGLSYYLADYPATEAVLDGGGLVPIARR